MELRDVRAKRCVRDPRIPSLQRRKLRCRVGGDFPEAPQLCLEGPGEPASFSREILGSQLQETWRSREQAGLRRAATECVSVCGQTALPAQPKCTQPSGVTAQGLAANRATQVARGAWSKALSTKSRPPWHGAGHKEGKGTVLKGTHY